MVLEVHVPAMGSGVCYQNNYKPYTVFIELHFLKTKKILIPV